VKPCHLVQAAEANREDGPTLNDLRRARELLKKRENCKLRRGVLFRQSMHKNEDKSISWRIEHAKRKRKDEIGITCSYRNLHDTVPSLVLQSFASSSPRRGDEATVNSQLLTAYPGAWESHVCNWNTVTGYKVAAAQPSTFAAYDLVYLILLQA
jgi:hypothetical protein